MIARRVLGTVGVVMGLCGVFALVCTILLFLGPALLLGRHEALNTLNPTYRR